MPSARSGAPAAVRTSPPTAQSARPARLAELEDALIHERLARATIARLGYIDDDGPAVVPVNIRVGPDRRIVFRTGADAPMARAMRRRVAVEIDGFEPATRSGWSILVRGVASDVTDAHDAAATSALDVPVDCWAPGTRERVIVVTPSKITGRVIPVPRDSDWFAGVPGS